MRLPGAGDLLSGLFGDPETEALLTGEAELAAMLRVEGALARVQGALGLIPADAAAFLAEACKRIRLDPAALAGETAANGVPVPALVTAFRRAAGRPELAGFLHWGATSQDIMDTALALRLRDLLALWEGRMRALLHALAALAESHSDLPLAARTYGQAAVPTSFGEVAASWGRPFLRHLDRLAELRPRLLSVSLSGAAGTLSAMGPQGAEVRAGLARALDLADPGASWHAERDGTGELAGWMAGILGSLGRMGEDLILLAQSGIGEVAIAGAGTSSTMPQKQNPVGPSVLVALARFGIGLSGTLHGAALHRQQRDGAAWFTEWLALPPLCLATGRALSLAHDLAGRIEPDAAAMRRSLDGGAGLIHAEALSFALAPRLGRPEAQAAVKALCREAQATGTPLASLAARDFPGTDWGGVLGGPDALGTAPHDARAFAAAVRARG